MITGGRTAHSAFGLPTEELIDENLRSSLPIDSLQAKKISKADIIIWDEIFNSSKYHVQAVDYLLKDIHKSDKTFAGKTILFCGDYRQIPPVICKADKAAIINSSIIYSNYWQNKIELTLSKNMRIINDPSFADFLMSIGNGKTPWYPIVGKQFIKLPEEMVLEGDNVQDLIEHVFGTNFADQDRLQNSVILTPTNFDAEVVNELISNQIEEDSKIYKAIDELENPESLVHFPLEFLEKETPSGMPPHHLSLKIGIPVILLRNIDVSSGLCNGTRMIIKQLHENFIECLLLSGSHAGMIAFIPKMVTSSNSNEAPYKLLRFQLPIRKSFAMTINKSQGQTFERVGIYLPQCVFSHGQLYVAFSRAREQKNVKVMIEKKYQLPSGNYTKNIVFPQLVPH